MEEKWSNTPQACPLKHLHMAVVHYITAGDYLAWSPSKENCPFWYSWQLSCGISAQEKKRDCSATYGRNAWPAHQLIYNSRVTVNTLTFTAAFQTCQTLQHNSYCMLQTVQHMQPFWVSSFTSQLQITIASFSQQLRFWPCLSTDHVFQPTSGHHCFLSGNFRFWKCLLTNNFRSWHVFHLTTSGQNMSFDRKLQDLTCLSTNNFRAWHVLQPTTSGPDMSLNWQLQGLTCL